MMRYIGAREAEICDLWKPPSALLDDVFNPPARPSFGSLHKIKPFVSHTLCISLLLWLAEQL